ncbi:MAG: metalloregulator ArsR/SmtB family transcription factor [Roseovarius sp.]
MTAEQAKTRTGLDIEAPQTAQIASVAKALGHPARIAIVSFLMARDGCVAGDIVDAVGLAQSTVSEHLRILKAAGLVTGAIEHPRICYSLNPAAAAPLQALLGELAGHAARPVAACYDPAAPAAPRSLATTKD